MEQWQPTAEEHLGQVVSRSPFHLPVAFQIVFDLFEAKLVPSRIRPAKERIKRGNCEPPKPGLFRPVDFSIIVHCRLGHHSQQTMWIASPCIAAQTVRLLAHKPGNRYTTHATEIRDQVLPVCSSFFIFLLKESSH